MLVAVGLLVAGLPSGVGATAVGGAALGGFNYGYDLTTQAPIGSNENKTAEATAQKVMASLPGTYDDVAIMGWGVDNPEPSPGVYDFDAIANRIALVQAEGGVPVITLAGVPDWMKGGAPGTTDWSQLLVPPLPQYDEDFAHLCAKIAVAFPQVRYFVVWKELHGFWDHDLDGWDAAGYTTLYNDVYTAIKAARPDAMVGGPYAPLPTFQSQHPGADKSPVQGPWGYILPQTLDMLSYWLEHKDGADFLAIDGSDVTKDDTLVGGALVSTEKYAAADQWLASQTALPIWWIESRLQPVDWMADHAAAVRVAALAEMASSGASVGMQWQPQDQKGWSDIGLWTSTATASGGRATVLAQDLQAALPVLRHGVTISSDEPKGVLVATGPDGTVAVNTNTTNSPARVSGAMVTLQSGQVRVAH